MSKYPLLEWRLSSDDLGGLISQGLSVNADLMPELDRLPHVLDPASFDLEYHETPSGGYWLLRIALKDD